MVYIASICEVMCHVSSIPNIFSVFFMLFATTVRASDKRIQGDNEYSDSEDEGEGGRRQRESFRHRKKLKADPASAAASSASAAAASAATTSNEGGDKTASESSSSAAPEKPSKCCPYRTFRAVTRSETLLYTGHMASYKNVL